MSLPWRKRALLATFGPLVAVGLAVHSLDHHGSTRRLTGTYDAIVVAGCAVKRDGKPSDALDRRTQLAVSLFKRGVAPKIIFTGGVGAGNISEAEAAASLAESLGVARSAMILEERSTSTEENAAFARAQTNAERVVVATDGFHVFRATRIFRRYFRDVAGVGTTSTHKRTRWLGALRELLLIPLAYLPPREPQAP